MHLLLLRATDRRLIPEKGKKAALPARKRAAMSNHMEE